VNIWPRHIQKPHPPIWIPGGGSIETWHWCAENDYVYSYLSYFGHIAAKAVMDGFWDEMARLGKDRNPYRAGFAQGVGVAESRAQAMELYRRPAEYLYGRCLHIDPRFAAPPGYQSEATQRTGVLGMMRRAAGRADNPYDFPQTMEEFVERGYIVIGSPDEVAEQLTELAHNLNVGQLMLLMQFGDMGKELAKYNTRLFAEKVLPRLKPIFAEWEDRWWPKPIAPAARALPAAFRPMAAGH
jgi:alkanesulfonate monooxygenase SsuD/methylene tetrahydromethanopterin reductase-like flavin-dependent oxidoreductase (luciferase family)